MDLSPLVLAMLQPDADRALLASVADYPEHLAALTDDGGENERAFALCCMAEHDVSQEPRDGSGKWTKGAGKKASTIKEAHEVGHAYGSDHSFGKNTSIGTANAFNDAIGEIKRSGAKMPRIVIVMDDESLKVPARSLGTMILFNPKLISELQRDNKIALKKWGRPILVDVSPEGIASHELTHSRISEMSEDERSHLYAEASKHIGKAKALLSMRAETDQDEFLAELGAAHLRGHALPPELKRLAHDIWPTEAATSFSDQIATPGHDGDRAESLLKHAKSSGAEILADLSRRAVSRLLANGPRQSLRQESLFDREELDRLQEEFAKVIGTAELLGRSRIRLRQLHAERYTEDDPIDFSCFDEARLMPMTPWKALEYFKRLVPTLGVDPEHFGPLMERHAFTMARATSTAILRKVQRIISNALESGETIEGGGRAVNEVLMRAGLTGTHDSYATLVFRTNTVEAYNAGSQREFSNPNLRIDFPVFKYLAIRDFRTRPKHAALGGKYFSRDVPFAEVRGTDAEDVIQCRCTFAPVFRARWARLQSQGARLEQWPMAA